MPGTIFISHSHRDTSLRDWVVEAVSGSGITPFVLEFDGWAGPESPIEKIRKAMTESVALFVLIGPHTKPQVSMDELRNSVSTGEEPDILFHTTNWIAAESGLASGLGKEVFVIEQTDRQVGYPVPFVDAYIPIAQGEADRRFVREICRDYAASSSTETPLQRSGWPVLTCPCPKCAARFRAPSPDIVDKCPTCNWYSPFSGKSLKPAGGYRPCP